MKVHIIGAGWAIPQKNRSKTSILVREEKNFLFDCGGDVAKAFDRFKLEYEDLDGIFISHKHIDHLSGLTSLLHAIWLSGRKKKLNIYSNSKTLELIEDLLELHELDQKLALVLNEIDGKGEISDMGIKYTELSHQVPTHGFRYKDFTYISDTSPQKDLVDFAQDSKLLLHEATYPSGDEKEAHKFGHSSVQDAINVLKKSGSNNLGIIHTSPRVDIKEEAKELGEDVLFPSDNTTLSFD